MVDHEDDIDGEENSSLLKGEKKDTESIGLCSNQTKVIISGVVVIVMVSVGIVIGAAYSNSNRSTNYAKDTTKLEACSEGNIRLPRNVVPIKYSIHLHPNITDGIFGFSGSVKILVQIKEPTDKIILHSKNLNILETIVHEAEGQDLSETATFPEVPVKGHEYCESLEQLVIRVKGTLSSNREYVVHIPFDAHLATTVLEGFYKSSYTTSTGEKRYLATTHFEATGARSAFPCFDEPSMKAKFTITMVRQSNHVALSNMPIMKTIGGPRDGLVVDTFQESVRMSTYLVAFVVCDYANKTQVTPKGGVEVGVWAPKEQIDQANFALDCAVKILDYYDEFFRVEFPLPKMDLIAIPDFAAGAMENWGLVTYRLTSILYDPKESSSSSKQWVATVVAHELAHQWFGDLVTMKWWNDLWLNEGFAAFVEYIGTDLIDKNWQMMDQFVISNVEKSMVLDSHLNSHPISVTVNDPAQINEIFDSISYDKGSSIIHMMQDFLGQDVFHEGLADYLNKYKYDNAVSDDLWRCMSTAEGGTLNVKKIMDTWTLQMGYPVIRVSRNPSNTSEVVATQSHFISDVVKEGVKPKSSPFNYTWDVPLTYHFGRGSAERKWFYHTENNASIPLDPAAKWLKVNVDQIGFYRVNYDQDNWNALAKQLDDDHKLLSPADRANILDDAFELARAGQISTLQALDLTTYLKKETEYVPFISGLGSIGYIGGMLLEREGYPLYEKYIIHTVRPLVETLGWNDEGSHLNKYLRGAVLGSVVAHNDTISVQKGRGLFKKWMEGAVIPPNLRSVVYQAGIKYGGQKEWDYMFNRYKHSQYPSEKQKLMYCLAASHNKTILESYLEMTLKNDIIKSQDTCSVIDAIAGNRKGRKLALNFVKRNWDILYDRYGRGSFDISRLIKAVFGGARTTEGLKDAEDFLDSHDLGSGKLAAKQTLAAIQNHITWLEKNENSVTDWLRKKVTV